MTDFQDKPIDTSLPNERNRTQLLNYTTSRKAHDHDIVAQALKSWRSDSRKSTLEVAKLLYTDKDELEDLEKAHEDKKIRARYQRRVSYLENGETKLSEKQIETLFKQSGFAETCKHLERLSKTNALELSIRNKKTFAEAHQKFLKEANFEYDLWFINAAGIPMFTDKENLLPTWLDNLKSEISYHLIWDLSLIDLEPEVEAVWNEHIKILQTDIIPKFSEDDGETGKIEIFTYFNSDWIDECRISKRILEQARRLPEEFENYQIDQGIKSKVVHFHEPFDIGSKDSSTESIQANTEPPPLEVQYLLKKYSYATGATLCYISKSMQGLKRPTLLNLEGSNVIPPFNAGRTSTDSSRLHTFFGMPHDSRVYNYINTMDQWLSTLYDREKN